MKEIKVTRSGIADVSLLLSCGEKDKWVAGRKPRIPRLALPALFNTSLECWREPEASDG